MYSENSPRHYAACSKRCRRSRRIKQQAFIIGVLAILCAIISCVSFAFIFTQTEPAENIFDGAYVACDVIETFDGITKTDVKIQNTGDVQSYIRVAVVITWMSDDGTKVTAAKPQVNSDYTIDYNNENLKWFYCESDGYWYYTDPVNVSDATATLIRNCKPIDGKAPDGFYLSVEIVASSIQSTPETVVKEQWGVTVDDDGKISK